MTAFETLVLDLLIAMDVMEFIRLIPMICRAFKRDWRRKKKDE